MAIRFNPGSTDKIVKMNALSMLRNISDMQTFGIDISMEYLKKTVLYHPDIPKNVYSSLGISFPNTETDTVKMVRPNNSSHTKILMK